MKKYKHILVALELDSDSDSTILNKAKELSQVYGASLTLIHGVEHLSSYGVAYGVPAGIDVEQELMKAANEMMATQAEKAGLKGCETIVQQGPAKYVVLEKAKDIKADLIVVGSHGRHGVRLLLGSTANAILHSAHCDVLAVRIQS